MTRKSCIVALCILTIVLTLMLVVSNDVARKGCVYRKKADLSEPDNPVIGNMTININREHAKRTVRDLGERAPAIWELMDCELVFLSDKYWEVATTAEK